MGKTTNLQEQFLDKLQQGQKSVTVVVVNGFQLKGRITGHDQYTILLDVAGVAHLVFKSAVSTIKEG